MKMHQPVVEHHGLFAEHDYACPVCRARPAVLSIQDDIMLPCWKCQDADWRLVQLPGWLPRWTWRMLGVKGPWK